MNKNTIIGFVLIGVIMFGFSWYQSKQYKEQMAAQAQLDSIAMVEQLQQMAMDSVQKATGENKAVAVKVENQAVYKDSLLNVARNAQEQILALANDKVCVEFTTKGAQFHRVTINDYMSYDSTALELVKPGMSQYGINLYAGEYINTKDFVFDVVEHNDSTLVMRMPFSNGGYLQQKYTLAAGAYNVKNALAAIAIGCRFDVPAKAICEALDGYIPSNNRSQLTETADNHLIVDAYNANPTSMMAALENFRLMEVEHKVAVLGDMKELGEGSVEEHRKIVAFLGECGFEKVILVGAEFGKVNANFEHYPDVEAVKGKFMQDKPMGKFVLIKGSNSMKLAQLKDIL